MDKRSGLKSGSMLALREISAEKYTAKFQMGVYFGKIQLINYLLKVRKGILPTEIIKYLLLELKANCRALKIRNMQTTPDEAERKRILRMLRR